MEKRIKAEIIEEVKSRPLEEMTDYKASEHRHAPPTRNFTPYPKTENVKNATEREKSITFGMGLLVCVVGLILTPILIGIPVLVVGLWMVFFSGSFANYAKKQKN